MSAFWSKVAELMGSKIDPNHVWAKVESNPHAGFALFSDAEKNPFEKAIKITGVSVQEAKSKLCGRVIAWDEMTVEEREAVKSGRLSLNMDQFARRLK